MYLKNLIYLTLLFYQLEYRVVVSGLIVRNEGFKFIKPLCRSILTKSFSSLIRVETKLDLWLKLSDVNDTITATEGTRKSAVKLSNSKMVGYDNRISSQGSFHSNENEANSDDPNSVEYLKYVKVGVLIRRMESSSDCTNFKTLRMTSLIDNKGKILDEYIDSESNNPLFNGIDNDFD